MKTLSLAFAFLISSVAFATGGHDHPHVKHGMIIFGTGPIYASHIVYKVPHNYQVLLEVKLDETTRAHYLDAKAKYPNEQYILLLDAMDISEIASVEQVTGRLFRENAAGEEAPVLDHVVLPRASYELIYFNEVPMSGGSGH